MGKKIAILLLVLVVIAAAAWYLFGRSHTPEPVPGGSDISLSVPASSTDVVVNAPLPNAVVQSPLTISGKARGNWFFEANIKVLLKDQNGNVIGRTGGTASGNWMTADLAPFTATINFQNPGTPYGTLEIQNDNPSGLPANEKSFSVPVRFDLAAYQVQVFWGSEQLNPGDTNCSAVFPGLREISATTTIATATLNVLLRGPDAGEKRAKYYTNIPDGVVVQKLTIENGVAHIDFNGALNSAGGSCRAAAIRAQIVHTLEQFPTVSSVVISVNGNVDQALQP